MQKWGNENKHAEMTNMNNLKFAQKLGLITLLLLVIFLIFLAWYKHTYSMGIAQSSEVNSPDLERKLLIGTQGSDFKDSVVTGILNHFRSDSIYIKVVDVSALENVDSSIFDAIVLIHTWEIGKPPESVQVFINKNYGLKNKVVVLTTSGEGSEKMDEVDAITGESVLEDAPLFTDKIIQKLNPLLKSNGIMEFTFATSAWRHPRNGKPL